jgi:hypothetical protein
MSQLITEQADFQLEQLPESVDTLSRLKETSFESASDLVSTCETSVTSFDDAFKEVSD